ncbi:MAG: hypothetical protein R3C13_04350 [Hyphomonas sp.]|uniref:hypothetical protein n=1 Tax=Hyphomonas sp. TaxID=87 RepID=UPI003528F6A4
MPHFTHKTLAACVAFASAAILAVPALASEDLGTGTTGALDEAPLIIDTVTVTGRSPEQAKAFVDEVLDANKPKEQLARWNRGVCTSVAGMREDQAQYLVDRISAHAASLGLQPEAPGCEPDILIYVTEDPNGLAKGLFEKRKSLFAYYSHRFILTEGREALEEFLTNDRPVRWWRISQEMNDDGRSLLGLAGGGEAALTKRGRSNVKISDVAPVSDSPGSRVSLDTREELFRTIIIVDVNQVKGVPLTAVADYLTMVSLAQVSADLETVSQPSILNLFSPSPGATVHAMTDWDADFLHSLYSVRGNRSATNQVYEIARNMKREPH